MGLGGLPAAGRHDRPPPGRRVQGYGQKKKRHATKSIVDYADERIVSFEELEPEERVFCSLLSNLVLGVPLVVISLIAGAM